MNPCVVLPWIVFLTASLFHQQPPQKNPADINETICREKFTLADSLALRNKPIQEVVAAMARSFIGTPYGANMIDRPGREQLIVNMQKLDCVTFYENALVLARCIKKNRLTFDDYKKELQFVRYRGGIIDGYTSRLHYTSDYFFDNEKKSIWKNVTKALGGIPWNKKINFMSAHTDLYWQLKTSPENIKKIQMVEEEMNRRTTFYIPKANVQKISSMIKDGDIIGITTAIDGLDCSHTGIALWQNGILHLLHAPMPGLNVQITALPLQGYLSKIKKDTGIMVVRPVEP